jgi:hypothetical protein
VPLEDKYERRVPMFDWKALFGLNLLLEQVLQRSISWIALVVKKLIMQTG